MRRRQTRVAPRRAPSQRWRRLLERPRDSWRTGEQQFRWAHLCALAARTLTSISGVVSWTPLLLVKGPIGRPARRQVLFYSQDFGKERGLEHGVVFQFRD